MPEIVWLTEVRTYGVLIKMGAFYSTVQYARNGEEIIELIENNEFETWREHAIDYESDDK